MKQSVTKMGFKRHLKVSLVLAALMAMFVAVGPAAYAQDDPFDSQYGAPPTAPPSDVCGDDSSDDGSGGGSDESGSSSGSTDPNCVESEDPGSSSSGNAISDGSGDVLADTDDGPVVDLLPTTGGLSLGAALLGGSAILGAGVVAVRRRS